MDRVSTPAEVDFGWLDKAIRLASRTAERRVQKLRVRHPNASDDQLIKKLETSFVTNVTTTGTATGAAAAVPGAGTAAAIGAAVGDGTYFVVASATHVLAMANVHGIDLEDYERQRALVMMVMMGGSAAGFIGRASQRTGRHLGGRAARAVPIETIRQINRALGPRFVTRYGTKQGIVVLGRAAPFGIGAAIGGGGNYLAAKTITKTTRRAFESDASSW